MAGQHDDEDHVPQVPISEYIRAVPGPGPATFTAAYIPLSQGGINPQIGFGGFTMGFGLSAAAASAPKPYRIYTAMGNFLGPAATDRRLTARITPVRSTRTFYTAMVLLTQQDDGGAQRNVMSILVDFHVPEPATLLRYSVPAALEWSPPEQGWSEQQMKDEARKAGVPDAIVEFYESRYTLSRFFDKAYVPEDIGTQRFCGMAPQRPTTQDGLPVTQMATAHWVRSRSLCETHSEAVAALAFFMDSGSAIMPMSFARVHPAKVQSCSSLDFAMRVFANEIDLSKWHLREEKSQAAGEGRTYQESRLWDQHGNLVASLTEQCILRPRAEKL